MFPFFVSLRLYRPPPPQPACPSGCPSTQSSCIFPSRLRLILFELPCVCVPRRIAAWHHDPQSEGARRGKRIAALQSLVEHAQGDWANSQQVVHHCYRGSTCACRTRADAAKLLYDTLCQAFLDTSPIVPASNKWTKLLPPMGWWMFAFGFHRLVVDAFIGARDEAEEEEGVVLNPHFVGFDSAQEFRAMRMARWSKARAWLTEPGTWLHLSVLVSVMRTAVKLMASTFQDSRCSADSNVLDFAWHSTSPAAVAMRDLGRKLGNMHHEHWAPVILSTPGGWSDASMFTTGSISMNYFASLFLRAVAPWDEFPLKLARLVHGAVPEATKNRIAEEVLHADACCLNPVDGFTLPFKEGLLTAEDVRSPERMEFLKDVFRMCQSSTISVENRFARVRQYSSNEGGVASNKKEKQK